MLIVSQDKKAILNFDNIEFIYVKPKPEQYAFGICAKFVQDEVYIGFYGTEERAKEVLQEIVKEYENVKAIFDCETGKIKNFINRPKIYKMPEK